MGRLVTGAPRPNRIPNMAAPELDLCIVTHDGVLEDKARGELADRGEDRYVTCN